MDKMEYLTALQINLRITLDTTPAAQPFRRCGGG